MPKIKPSTELIAGILARVPEGFISLSTLAQRVEVTNKTAQMLVETSRVAHDGDHYYDPSRISLETLRERRKWCRPGLPNVSKRGDFSEPTIAERWQKRAERLAEFSDPAYARVMEKIEAHTEGYMPLEELAPTSEDTIAVQTLLRLGLLKHSDTLVYDPLRLGYKTMRSVSRQYRLLPLRQQILDYLSAKPGQTASRNEIIAQFGLPMLQEVLSSGGFSTFTVPIQKARTTSETWIRPAGADAQAALNTALDTVRITDEMWQPALEMCGDHIRPGARDGKRRKTQVVARTYIVSTAAKRLGIKQETVEKAVSEGVLISFEDPEERIRIPAFLIEGLVEDPAALEYVTAFERVRTKEIALVSDVTYATAYRRLKKADIHTTQPEWGQVRGQWNLPDTLREFREILKVKATERRAERQARIAALLEQERLRREYERELLEQERRRREELRARLVEAFPTWRNDSRVDQQITLHVGPPNSGKTHNALDTLIQAGSGWYLAPLRLLAFEIFDRLNQQNVPCNLLTGEEYISIPGARITAATIEMFNASEDSACVVIDEAQMLADSDRGWAWTRALMTAQAPEIRVIGPERVRPLVEKLAASAAIPLKVYEHQRLTPIKIAERAWSLRELPKRTILVAFSRWMVLHLKSDLERMNRRVSVVYGNLPPEVRRKQADRFASGETEICVATDAVGMGLNLPADYVCFYEVEKFDGKRTRRLTADEIQQIGGRAGRYGLSTGGEIGATTKQNLQYVSRLYYDDPQILTHARVAPSVEDLEMIPGNLAERLGQWASLQSIPDDLRNVIKTADMNERIELAKMLDDREVNMLGLELALKLVNAPTRQSSRDYWLRCVKAILRSVKLPLPEGAPALIVDSDDLEFTEYCISCADIYLWLARRPEFRFFAPEEEHVRHLRKDWSSRIDRALVLKLDTSRRCAQCKRPLPLGYRYRVCDRCYNRRYDYDSYEDYYPGR